MKKDLTPAENKPNQSQKTGDYHIAFEDFAQAVDKAHNDLEARIKALEEKLVKIESGLPCQFCGALGVHQCPKDSNMKELFNSK